MKWYFSVTCRDCNGGRDPKGCFDGGSEWFGPFETEKEATEAQEKHQKEYDCALWEYEVYGAEMRPVGGGA